MADQTDLNGESDDRTVEIESFGRSDRSALERSASEVFRKLENIEQRELDLVNLNEEYEVKIHELNSEIEALKRDNGEKKRVIEEFESSKETFNAVAARASDLEIEISRLHHDFGEAVNAAEEANQEISELKKVIEDLKRSESEKEVKIQSLENEKLHLSERINVEIEEIKEFRSKSETKIQDLTQKLKESEARVKNSTEERAKIERELKSVIEEKDSEIHRLKNLVEKLSLGKKEDEKIKIELKEAIRKSEDIVKDRDFKGLKVDWASAAAAVASTGTIAAAVAILYFNYGKRR